MQVPAFDLNGHGIALGPVSGIVYVMARGSSTDSISQLALGHLPAATSSAAAMLTTDRARFQRHPDRHRHRDRLAAGRCCLHARPVGDGGAGWLAHGPHRPPLPAHDHRHQWRRSRGQAGIHAGCAPGAVHRVVQETGVPRSGRRSRFLVVSKGIPCPCAPSDRPPAARLHIPDPWHRNGGLDRRSCRIAGRRAACHQDHREQRRRPGRDPGADHRDPPMVCRMPSRARATSINAPGPPNHCHVVTKQPGRFP